MSIPKPGIGERETTLIDSCMADPNMSADYLQDRRYMIRRTAYDERTSLAK